jgi:hypothetical protein
MQEFLNGLNVGGLHTFRAFLCLVGNSLTFVQGFVTTALYCGIMYKYIFTAVCRCNKAEPFGIVEPFDCAVQHVSTLVYSLLEMLQLLLSSRGSCSESLADFVNSPLLEKQYLTV